MTVDLDELERLGREATAGPWRHGIVTHEASRFGKSTVVEISRDEDTLFRGLPNDEPSTDDARLIVFLRNNAASIAAELRELRAALATARTAALEEAARVCEETAKAMGAVGPLGYAGAAQAAANVRALGAVPK